MNEANVLRSASRVLELRLPKGWLSRLVPTRGGVGEIDAIWEITGPDGAEARIATEAKSRLVPRAVEQVKRQLEQFSAEPGIVVAPFLSPATRDRLRAFEINYLDLTGNVWLRLTRPGLYITTEGAVADPTPSAEPTRTLRGPKAGRVVRALCDVTSLLTVSGLAEVAGVDVSYASRLVEWLAREAVLERRPRGSVVKVDRAALVRRWSTDYSVLTSNDSRGYLAPRGLDQLVQRLISQSSRRPYAVTGSLAANKLAPVAPTRLGLIYTEDTEAIAAELDLRVADVGANVMLLTPFDEVVFKRTWDADGMRCVALSQLAVDLLTSPGRGPAEAEPVLARMAS